MKRTYEKPTLVKRDALPLVVAQAPSDLPDSDRRLKTDIIKVGMLMVGVPLYRFRYFWSPDVFVGVMAQDLLTVRPDAVITGPSGFMRVDYAVLGTRMMRWDEWQAAGGERQSMPTDANGSDSDRNPTNWTSPN